MREVIAAVSFARTPLPEIGPKANAILSLGWEHRDRGDPWVVALAKRFPPDEPDPEAELREVMGDYWIDADGIKQLQHRWPEATGG